MKKAQIQRSVSVEELVGFFETQKEKEDFFAVTPTPAPKKKRKICRSSPDLSSPESRIPKKKKKGIEELKKKFYTAMSNVLPGDLMVPVTDKRLRHLNQSEMEEDKDRMVDLHKHLNLTSSNGSDQ